VSLIYFIADESSYLGQDTAVSTNNWHVTCCNC